MQMIEQTAEFLQKNSGVLILVVCMLFTGRNAPALKTEQETGKKAGRHKRKYGVSF